jgi:putative spermidine/putrescine transport system permease protein
VASTPAQAASRDAAPSKFTSATAAKRVEERLVDWLPAIPLLLLAAAFLIAPTVRLVVDSFHGSQGWTLDFWRDTFQSRGSREAIRTSLKLAITCATLSLLIGAPLAWVISRMVVLRRSVWLSLLNVAANFGGIGLAFGYIATLGSFGMVTLAVQKIDSGFTPPAIGSLSSLIIAYEYTNIPLFVLLTLPAMGILRTEWMEAADVSSASSLQFWRYIGIPVLTPFLAAGWLLIFTWSMGIYGLAYAIGSGAAAIGQLRLITLQIGLTLNRGVGEQERAYVLAVVLLLFAIVTLLIYRVTMRRALRWFV